MNWIMDMCMGPAATITEASALLGLDLRAWFGGMDVYLFDQLLKGRLLPGQRILDAGCGTGRNLPYFFRSGFDVYAADEDEDALDHVREIAAELAPRVPMDHFRVEKVENLSFPGEYFDVVLCLAVLHFARDEDHFQSMLRSLWATLRPGGIFFARLASTIGMEGKLIPLGGGKFRLPDGAEWFLAEGAVLAQCTQELGAEWLEPIKSTYVQDRRSMATWVLRKGMART